MESFVGKKVKINWDKVDYTTNHITKSIHEKGVDKEYTVVHDIFLKGNIVGVEVDSEYQGYLCALRLEEIII